MKFGSVRIVFNGFLIISLLVNSFIYCTQIFGKYFLRVLIMVSSKSGTIRNLIISLITSCNELTLAIAASVHFQLTLMNNEETFYSRFSWNFEADTSEFRDNLEELFPLFYMYGDISRRFNTISISEGFINIHVLL